MKQENLSLMSNSFNTITKMETKFVIKSANGNRYLQNQKIGNDWLEYAYDATHFDSEEDCIKEMKKWRGKFMIEKIYIITR